jgi:hypothetical protein
MLNGIIPVSGRDRKRSVILTGLVMITSLVLVACGPTATRVH